MEEVKEVKKFEDEDVIFETQVEREFFKFFK